MIKRQLNEKFQEDGFLLKAYYKKSAYRCSIFDKKSKISRKICFFYSYGHCSRIFECQESDKKYVFILINN